MKNKTAGILLAALALVCIAASFALRGMPADVARILGLAALLGFVALKVYNGIKNK